MSRRNQHIDVPARLRQFPCRMKYSKMSSRENCFGSACSC